MPERGEVYLFTQRFALKFPVGTIIDRVTSLSTSLPHLINTPSTIKTIASKGKKTYIIFTDGNALLISYGMTGSWTLKNTKWSNYEERKESITYEEAIMFASQNKQFGSELVTIIKNLRKKLGHFSLWDMEGCYDTDGYEEYLTELEQKFSKIVQV